MERDENAVLAVRICGLAFAAVLLRALVWWAASQWPRWGVDARDAAYHLSYLTGMGLGVGAFLLAPALRSLAAPEGPDGAKDAVREALRLGVLVLGVYYALGLVVSLAAVPQELVRGQTISVPWVPAGTVLVLLLWPQGLVRVLRRRAEPGPQADGPRVVIAAGLALAGLAMLLRSLASAVARAGWITHSSAAVPGLAQRDLAADCLLAAMAAAAVWWSGRIAQRLCSDRQGAARPAAPLGPGAILRLAVYLIGICEVVALVAYCALLALPQRVELISPKVSLAVSLALRAALVTAVAWGVRALGRRLARRVYPGESAGAEAMARATVIVQVGLLLAALLWLVRALDLAPRPSPRALYTLVVGLVLLGFWAEIGRWLVGPSEADEGGMRQQRAGTLRPWLVLLGFYVGIGPLARTLVWLLGVARVLAPVAWPPEAGMHGLAWPLPSPALAAGLLLVLAARPLARWLGHDSLFGRWRNMGWAGKVKG